jgi:membrane protein implicated in regulation of membrane protease activity
VSEQRAVRTGAVAVTAAAVVLPIFMAVPSKLPATAMGSGLLLYLERGVVVFAILLFLLVFLHRSLVHGELPKAVSERGAEWSDLATRTTMATDSVHDEIDALRLRLEALQERVEASGMVPQ